MLTWGGGVPKRESEPYNEHHHGRQVHEPMDIGAEANFFAGLQHLSHVAHPLDLSSAPGKIRLAQGVWCHALSELAKVTVMPKGEVPIRSEQEADECLHCAIIDMVDDRIAAGGANAADLTTLIVESLVDIILRVPEEEQPSSWRTRWRLWATSFFRRAAPTIAALDQRISGVHSHG